MYRLSSKIAKSLGSGCQGLPRGVLVVSAGENDSDIIPEGCVLQAALKLSREAGLQVHLNESPSHGLQDSGGSSLVKSGLDLKCSYPVYLKPRTHDVVDDEKGLHSVDKPKVDNKDSIQPVISLGRTLHLVALQLISLLVNERHRDMTFAILYDLLPLLKPPVEKSLDGKVCSLTC